MTPYNSERYRLIPDGLVYDEAFNELPPLTQLLFYKLIGCPEMNLLGIFKLRPARVTTIEFGMSEADFAEALHQLEKADFILYSEQTREVAITYWMAWGIAKGGTPVEDGLKRAQAKLENKDLGLQVWDKLHSKHLEVPEGVSKAVSKALGINTF